MYMIVAQHATVTSEAHPDLHLTANDDRLSMFTMSSDFYGERSQLDSFRVRYLDH